MNKEKLKPCPHCRGKAKMEKYSGVMIYTAIECVNCFCGTGHEESEEEAIEAWNKRTPDIVYCRECVYLRGIDIGVEYCITYGIEKNYDDYYSRGKRRGQEDGN